LVSFSLRNDYPLSFIFQGAGSVQIKISARHGDLSETTRSRIREKVEKLTRFFERITAIEVTVDLERRDAPVADVRVSVERKRDFVASEQAEELMVAMDAVLHKLEQQIRKHKEKIQDRHRGSGHRQQEAPSSPEQASR
jgi:putative sigma-54 modulation protein